MKWHLIESVSLDKPALGSPCNGCGVCCIAQVCDLGVALGDDQNCKALLQRSDGTFSCGLVEDPYRFIPEVDLSKWLTLDQMSGGAAGEQALKSLYAEMLGAGRGCDSDDEALQECIEEAQRFCQLPLSLHS
ncbi:hypothetical protein PZT57_30825 [Pseudomonas aeruginosa]|uniref:hypothetical protein n=1 Tax=Pseudomonas aeruginosa TaxID=287 RepID=UPI002B26ACFC|nr:hypothetical protein [Pseudomonas aeruginosa]MEA8593044.1 hypothetical protein [Pseudomonas aeruginosa]